MNWQPLMNSVYGSDIAAPPQEMHINTRKVSSRVELQQKCQENHGQIVTKFREMPPLLAFPKSHPIQLPASCRGLHSHYLGKCKHYAVTMEKIMTVMTVYSLANGRPSQLEGAALASTPRNTLI